MEIDLTPRLANKVFGGDGGSYSAWSSSKLPMLHEGDIGAVKLFIENNGFALPNYSDSARVAYVLQGNGVVGIVLPEKEEKVLLVKKGNAIALPFGVITWWYNKEDTEFVVLFLGDTKTAHRRGEFTDFYLNGSNGIFTDFSTKFVSRAWDFEDSVVKTLVGKQIGKGIVKLGGGRVVVLNTKNLPLVSEVGLGADLVGLDGNAMCSRGFSCDSALQMTYIVRGSGRVQVVGVYRKRILETIVTAGNLFVVPRFFLVSKIADPEGLERFSIITTANPIFTHLGGSIGAWKTLSSQVLEASFNVVSDTEKFFRLKRTSDAIFFPPSK